VGGCQWTCGTFLRPAFVLPGTRKIVLLAAIVLLFTPTPARGDGLFFNDAGGLRGILAPTGYRYVTIGERNVVMLVRIAPDLHVAAERPLPGNYTVPAVATDRTTAGLSADGQTMVLVEPRIRWGRKHTRFLLMSLPGMHVHKAVTLRGDFTFDAMSPDASRLYFIHYLSKADPTRYEVRAFDTVTGRLVPGAIVDRSEPDEDMRGLPLSRVTSADGRFAYTFYDGGGNTPFVHVLDTIAGEAHCVDVDELAGRQDIYSFGLRREPTGDVAIMQRGRPFLVVERTSFRVIEPGNGAPASREKDVSWAPIGAGAVALLALGAVSFVLARRRRPATA
jgi:hypothetical protein